MILHRESQQDVSAAPQWRDPAQQAFLLLRTVFTVAPILFGLDKFFEVLTDWERYLAPEINDLIPGTAHQAMLIVGVVEIAAGLAGRRAAADRRLRRRRLAGGDHPQPAAHRRLLRRGAARLRPARGRAGPGTAGHRPQALARLPTCRKR